ncbi:MAG: NAD-dependent epimerase/dehydratase family protein [Pseudonocardiales bacterium]
MGAVAPRHILVTGGAGFVGSHVADLLAEQGATVRILDVLLPAAHRGRPDYLGNHEMIEGDVRDGAVLDRALAGVDAVCHQAAMVGLGVGVADMPGYVAHNDLGTAHLLAAMDRAGVATLVLASSMVIYGEGCYSCAEHGLVRPPARAAADLTAGQFDPRCPVCAAPLEPGLVPEDAAPDPRNTYAATKLAQEYLAATWARETGGTAVALRYHNIYGPRMPRNTPYAGVASIFRSALARGQAPQVFEDGAQRRDFIHVRDVAAANLAALRYASNGFTAFNICSGQPHTIADMAVALSQACEGPPPQITGRFRLGDVRHIVASPARATTELNFHATTTFTEGMTEFATAPLRP